MGSNKQQSLEVIDRDIESLTASILSDNYLSKESVKSKIESFVAYAMIDLSTSNLSNLEKYALHLKTGISNGKYDYDRKLKQSKMVELGTINDKIKIENRVLHSLKDWSDYNLLKYYVVKKYGKEVLIDFSEMTQKEKLDFYKPYMKLVANQVNEKFRKENYPSKK